MVYTNRSGKRKTSIGSIIGLAIYAFFVLTLTGVLGAVLDEIGFKSLFLNTSENIYFLLSLFVVFSIQGLLSAALLSVIHRGKSFTQRFFLPWVVGVVITCFYICGYFLFGKGGVLLDSLGVFFSFVVGIVSLWGSFTLWQKKPEKRF